MNVKIMPKKVIFVKWYEKGRSVVESPITLNLMAEILLKNSRSHLVRVNINGSFFLQKINDRILLINFYMSVLGYFTESYLICISYNYAVDSSNLTIFQKYIVRVCMYNTHVEFHI